MCYEVWLDACIRMFKVAGACNRWSNRPRLLVHPMFSVVGKTCPFCPLYFCPGFCPAGQNSAEILTGHNWADMHIRMCRFICNGIITMPIDAQWYGVHHHCCKMADDGMWDVASMLVHVQCTEFVCRYKIYYKFYTNQLLHFVDLITTSFACWA